MAQELFLPLANTNTWPEAVPAETTQNTALKS